MNDSLNLRAAQLAGGSEAYILDVDDIESRLVVQTSLQSGLSAVHTDLFDFGGDEIYIVDEPRLVGSTFGKALFAYETSSALGLRLANGRTLLNPPMETRIGPGDQIIVIAEDDSAVRLGGRPPAVQDEAIVRPRTHRPEPRRILIIGWNERASRIIKQLDNYLAPESRVHVAARRLGARAPRARSTTSSRASRTSAWSSPRPTPRTATSSNASTSPCTST